MSAELTLYASGSEGVATSGATPGRRGTHNVLRFPDDAVRYAIWLLRVPDDYGGGGLTFTPLWTAVATSGEVVWACDAEKLIANGQDLDSDGFGADTAHGAGTTVEAQSGEIVKAPALAVSHTNLGSPAAGDLIRFRIWRDTGDADDDATGIAELLAVDVFETGT